LKDRGQVLNDWSMECRGKGKQEKKGGPGDDHPEWSRGKKKEKTQRKDGGPLVGK